MINFKNDRELILAYAQHLDDKFGEFFDVKNLSEFAEACFNQNTIDELRYLLNQVTADRADCNEWRITTTQWFNAIAQALAAKLLERNDFKLPE